MTLDLMIVYSCFTSILRIFPHGSLPIAGFGLHGADRLFYRATPAVTWGLGFYRATPAVTWGLSFYRATPAVTLGLCFCRATPAVTWGLGFCSLIRRVTPFCGLICLQQ
jgi:hypothetical protein